MSRSAPCPHRPPCPGCPRFDQPGPPPAAVEAIEALCLAHGLPAPPIHTLSGRGHRHRARLAVRGRARSPKIGLFAEGSHQIVDTPNCAVHHPAINEAARDLRAAIRETGIAPYQEAHHRGALRYVQIVVERETSRVQVVLVGNGGQPDVLGDLPAVFERRMGERLQGLFFNAQPERNNTILGRETIHLAGAPAIHERLGGVEVAFPPDAFGQNHLPLFAEAIDRIHALVPAAAKVTEFYCGVGAIGLGLLAQGHPIAFNERSPAGLAGLAQGLALLPTEVQDCARRFDGAAGDRLDAIAEAEVVIVDPPRKGLDRPLLDALVAAPPRRLIYLACGLPRLLEELPILLASGQVRLSGVELFDFFPFTGHVETLVWLDRNGEQSPHRFSTPANGAAAR